jgi:phosphomevalonate kinase
MATTTAVSAPGKVLVTGGYLVLERPNAGLVLALSARFHVQVGFVSC